MKTHAKLPSLASLAQLFVALKPTIGDDFRASDDCDNDTPAMFVTVGWSDESGGWSYQTGDNSFMGGAYHYPHWAVITLERRSNCRVLARDVQSQLLDCIAWQ